MSEKVDAEIAEIQSDVANWPKDQRAIFMRGLMSGLGLSASVAEEAGCKLSDNKSFVGFAEFLVLNAPPVKKRKVIGRNPKDSMEQLIDDIRELLRRAIATSLRIHKRTYDESLDVEDLVNKSLLTVIAIGNRDALDKAIQDIRIMRSITGGEVDRETVKSEVEDCYERFRFEVAAITRLNELRKRGGFAPKDIWALLRSNVQVNNQYDEDLSEADARYR